MNSKISKLINTITVIILFIFSTSHAANINVTGSNGAIATDGACSISEAIQAANTNTAVNECIAGSGDDVIIIFNDITLTTTIDSTFGNTGTPAIESHLTIEGNGFKLERDQNLSSSCLGIITTKFRVLNIALFGNLILKNIEINNGCIIGTIPSFGGGIYNNGTLRLNNVTLNNNKASTGGGIYNNRVISTIHNSNFTENFALAVAGAIYVASGRSIDTISNSNFIQNSSTFSGAIYATNATIGTIIRSVFSNNTSSSIDTEAGGAAIHNSGSMITRITNSTFHGNIAQNDGGAILNSNNGNIASIENSTFSENSATSGDGDSIHNSSSINFINNSSFIANTIDDEAITNVDTINITNSLFVGYNSDCINIGTINGSNNMSDNATGGCPGLLPTILTATTVAPLADNGGATMTHALLFGSEALDVGDVNSSTTDQRGFAVFGIRDIGAYEVQLAEFCANDSTLSTDGFTVDADSIAAFIFAMECSQHNGDVVDTINITNDLTIDVPYETIPGTRYDNGLPKITTPMVIDGQGFTLKRNSNLTCNLNGTQEPGEFRILYNEDVLTLQNITLENGCADGVFGNSFGGGLVNEGLLSLINTTFTQNQAYSGGGGVYLDLGRVIEISNSHFSNNSTEGSGGAIRNNRAINLIENTTFTGNLAVGSGGAIDNQMSIDDIRNSTFLNNDTSTSGGAIANFDILSDLLNNTFSANSSADDGGAIYNNSTIDSVRNNTFSGNTAANLGSAIRNDVGSTFNLLRNTLFHNNNNNDCSGSIFNSNNNLSDNAASGCPGLISPMLTSASVKQLADNGGPTITHGLQPGSQALDASVNGFPIDQRGFSSNGVRDIGAFEAQSDELCPVLLQVNGFNTLVANVDELYTAINCSNTNGNNLDTIILSADITVLFDYENDPVIGLSGTPGITTPLVLDGQGFMIQRDVSLTCNLDEINDPGEFRILHNHTGNTLDLINITLDNGCADAALNTPFASGGALYNEGTLSIINTSFSQNQAGSGGALFHSGGTITEISNSTFSANTAINFGGAIQNMSDITTIQNSTFSGNSSTDSNGGAIYNSVGNTIVNISMSTFSGNSSSATHSGGAIFSGGTINFIRSSLFHNNSTDDCDIGPIISGFFNMSDNAASGCPELLATTLTSSTISVLADYGGPTQTHILLAGSEAVDRGSELLQTDQRGFFITDGDRDIGAVEDQTPVVTAPMNITIEATGALTAVNIVAATVFDPDQPNLMATTPSNLGPFALGQHGIVWIATDNHGHTDNDFQIISIVDTTPPTITLLGDSTVVLNIGDSYVDAGATAVDLVDGMISSGAINVVNPVNTALAGNYTITYDVQDNAGNSAIQITRLVKVQASIGGTISGLINSNTVTITDGNEPLVLGNSSYTFTTHLDSGASYSVIMTDSPTSQICEISNNTGTITDSNINNINVTCGPLVYFIGGMASGLEIGNPVILELDTELLTVTDNAAFVFLTPLQDGENYTVNIDTLPISYDCDLVNPTGMIATNDITDVEVSCTIIDNVFNDSFEDLP